MRRPLPTRPTGGSGMNRRQALARMAAGMLIVPAGVIVTGCGMRGPNDDGMGMSGGMPDWMMSRGGMDRAMMRDMRIIHDLLVNHEEILRQVEDIPGGIRSRTTSDNAEIADLIRTHVRQMRRRIERGDPIRQMDPVFREIFDHHDEIEMALEDVNGGVRVIETSADRQVTLLIRQHARRAVSEFIASGMDRAMRPTPLPDGYRD